MKYQFILRNYILLYFFIILTGCESMENRWQNTKSINTIEAYEDFRNEFPDSGFEDSIDIMIETIVFNEVEQQGNFETYLIKYPAGLFSEKIAKLTSESQYYSILNKYGKALDSQFSKAAINEIENLISSYASSDIFEIDEKAIMHGERAIIRRIISNGPGNRLVFDGVDSVLKLPNIGEFLRVWSPEKDGDYTISSLSRHPLLSMTVYGGDPLVLFTDFSYDFIGDHSSNGIVGLYFGIYFYIDGYDSSHIPIPLSSSSLTHTGRIVQNSEGQYVSIPHYGEFPNKSIGFQREYFSSTQGSANIPVKPENFIRLFRNQCILRFVGTIKLDLGDYEDVIINGEGDRNNRLTFALLNEIGLVYIRGRGNIVFNNGKRAELGYEEKPIISKK